MTEKRINAFDNYHATITNEHGEPVNLHFVALLSGKKDAIPIVLLHGWPGSFLEFLDLLDHARSLYKPEDLPYSFIVPSLPGYGFSSDYSSQNESTCESMAYAVEQLMVGLGFGDGYVAQGGDIGSFVARILAARHSARAVHSTVTPGPRLKSLPFLTMKYSQFCSDASAFRCSNGRCG